jgi:menaquinone-dependent protoporphyrinogen IX oxidase
MKEDFERVIVEFNNSAAKIYSILFKQFLKSIHNFNRSEEENVFNMQVAKFADSLKYQLEEQVKKILETADTEIYDQLQLALSARISFYLREFQIKCRAL